MHRKHDYVHGVDADRQGQGVLLVTEPHSELDAGLLVVIFSSSHPPVFDWADWTRRCRRLPDTEFGSLLATASETVEQEFLGLLVTSMYQSLLEGKTDCPISGVFGAGKTLSAAAMIAGLLVMDPSLTIMIVTKENVAAHAFVKHFLRLELPESINCLVGRLVGYVEMKKGPANQTALDIPPAFRNDVLRSKRVIVGCGGGFHQECQQPYSPVASWMEEADVALNDEGQQYGNLDEASAIARVPRKCLVVWCGDHKQTPGGLRKTDEAKAFRRKLLRRPIALRGDTKHLQPNMLGKVVLRYLDGMDEPLIHWVQVILRATMGGRSASSEEDIVTCNYCVKKLGALTTKSCGPPPAVLHW